MTIDDIRKKPTTTTPITAELNPVSTTTQTPTNINLGEQTNKAMTSQKPAEVKSEVKSDAKTEIPKVTSSQELIDVLNSIKPDETKLKAEQQKLARDKLFASLNRGISNLANLYFTTQYAPAVKQSTGLSEYYQQRYDKLQDDYKNDLYKYANARLSQLSNQQSADYQNAMINLKYNQAEAEEARKDAEREEESLYNELKRVNQELQNKYLPQEKEAELKVKAASLQQKLQQTRVLKAQEGRIYKEIKASDDKNYVYWPIDENGNQVRIPKSKLTKTNISQIYKALGGPDSMTDMMGNTKAVTQDYMEQYIGRNIGGSGSAKARRLVNNLAGRLGTSNYSEFE